MRPVKLVVPNMTTLALSILALAGPTPDTTVEYTFKNIKAAYFAEKGWPMLEQLTPGVKRSPSATAPQGAGVWIWVDEKQNRFVIGSKDDSAKAVAQYLPEFDVAPKPVRLAVRLARSDWGVESKSTIETVNNAETSFTSAQVGLGVTLRPRINNDGTVTLWITFAQDGKSLATNVMRVRSGFRICFRNGKAFALGPAEKFHVPADAFSAKPALPASVEVDVTPEIG